MSDKEQITVIVDEIIGTNAYIDGELQPKREGATYVVAPVESEQT